jgi:putative AlgH/UPF0301 family transcriptional regulator
MRFYGKDSHCLLATPSLNNDRIFKQSVVLLIKQQSHQYVGVILNQASHITLTQLNEKHHLDLTESACEQTKIALGGLLMNHQLFALNDISDHYLLEPCPLTDIKSYLKFPNNVRFFVGICAWVQGQVEHEIIKGYWHAFQPDHDLVFQTPFEAIYHESLRRIKISPHSYLSSKIGYA